MKKFIAIATLALCATAAQAVIVGWTAYPSSNPTSSVTGGNYFTFSLADVTKVGSDTTAGYDGSIAAGKYSISSLAFAIMSYSYWNDASEQVIGAILTQNSDNGTVLAASTGTNFYWNGHGGNQNWPSTSAKGMLEFVFSTDQILEHDGTYRIYFLTTDSAGAGVDQALVDTSIADLDASAYYNVANQVLITDNNRADYRAQVLPEPTVLALLALGVAGVALKRKVA